ncbi:hypothetical protein TZ00_02175 [Agreia bicolorata]|uniref:Alternate signal-mediated exported protein, RER_14450 family n=2 Tax=Agreia bicolorata TaxID=110935 RepID=A0ABR5CJ69_9MICO|nr:hypothetical protein TZ00_02175 [Agreia bicolorata]
MSALTVVAALVATVVVYGITPHGDDINAPFNVRGNIGDVLTGRTLTGSVTSVRLASSIDATAADSDWTGETTGTWVVVEADIAARFEPSSLYRPTLTIGDTTYYATERLSLVTLDDGSVRPGISSAGVILFEVANDQLQSADAAKAEIGINSSFQSILDSRLVTEVDLTSLRVEANLAVSRPEERVL